MKRLFAGCVLSLSMVFVASGGYAQQCDNPGSSEDVAYCLGAELRESDGKINKTYRALMGKLGQDEKESLRQEQREWIKERDAVCASASKESNREKWFQWLLKDYGKTVCVTRYTRQRIAELDGMLTDLSSKPQAQKPQSKPIKKKMKSVQGSYAIWSAEKKSGRWYFEVTVNRGGIARFSPSALWIGCRDKKINQNAGMLLNIRGSDTSAPVSRLGFALDLESGKLYFRTNGNWYEDKPGSSGGIDLKLNPHSCGMETTVLIAPLVDKGYLQPNFGGKPFMYSMPDGYRPFVEAGR